MYTISKPKVVALKVPSTKMLTSSFLLMLFEFTSIYFGSSMCTLLKTLVI